MSPTAFVDNKPERGRGSITPEAVVVFRIAVCAVSGVGEKMATAVAAVVVAARGMTVVTRRTGRSVLNKNKWPWDILGGGGCAVHVIRRVAGSRILWLRGVHGQRLCPGKRLLQVKTRTSGRDGDRHGRTHGRWHILWNLLLGNHWRGNE